VQPATSEEENRLTQSLHKARLLWQSKSVSGQTVPSITDVKSFKLENHAGVCKQLFGRSKLLQGGRETSCKLSQ
jgi:hypothetical protein